ncbi:glycoside hydrolase domain-containing protein [Glycomyces dulcitolivorans]|uniref:glycoside hydrolase domain-containing protein n=1 Tax=Glycomyces dulcitolivorans TaxID=2200759 RepID=UPI000DD36668|nr:glycoside hydrolase domain-containing protein [Glycomyces dulcitolivorans]
MDIKVKEAQIWVNDLCEGVAGYIPCDEDGVVGQGTMRSLIMGLQHVLFTSAEYPAQVSGVFGPTTLSLLEGWGDIGMSTTSPNICNLVRHGLWCKGYSGGYTDGVIDQEVADSIYALRADIGVVSGSFVSPKVFKALLTTDPYELADGGNDWLRLAQKHLNLNYVDIPAFSICPTDGLPSRNYQQSLMMGIQAEIGIAPSQITGLFGPGTQAGLKTAPFQLSQTNYSAPITALFVAACLMNEGYFDGTKYTIDWRMQYTQEVTDFVTGFQKFSKLANANGSADFDTWAQLLVSSGNPDRLYRRIASDCISEITPSRGAALYRAGYRTVGRYLDEDTERIPEEDWLYKWIQDGELESIFGAGLHCFPISQYYGGAIGEFTYANGVNEATKAHLKAVEYGFEAGTCIYFAVDYDALDSEVTSNILPYFRGVREGLQSQGGRYTAGVYGSRNVCIRVSAAGLAKWSFVSGMSWGFSGNQGYPLPPNWVFNQIKEANFVVSSSDSFGLDSNIARYDSVLGVDHVQVDTSREEYLDRLDAIYDAIFSGGWVDHFDPDSTDDTGRNWNANVLAHFYLKQSQFGEALDGDPSAGDVDRALPLLDVKGWVEHAMGVFGNGRSTAVQVFDDLNVNFAKAFAALSPLTVMRTVPIPFGGEPMISTRRGPIGDMARLYNQWRNRRGEYPSGFDFCQQYMGRFEVPSFLTVADYMATNYGRMIRYLSIPPGDESAARPLYNAALRSAWEYSLTDAIGYFVGGTAAEMTASLREEFVEVSQIDSDATDVHDLWRKELLLEVGTAQGQIDKLPHKLASAELDGFVSGYVDRMIAMSNGDF